MRKPRNRQQEQVELSCEIKKDTGKALLISIGGVDNWIPMSQVHYYSMQQGIIRITPWILKEKGLIILGA